MKEIGTFGMQQIHFRPIHSVPSAPRLLRSAEGIRPAAQNLHEVPVFGIARGDRLARAQMEPAKRVEQNNVTEPVEEGIVFDSQKYIQNAGVTKTNGNNRPFGISEEGMEYVLAFFGEEQKKKKKILSGFMSAFRRIFSGVPQHGAKEQIKYTLAA